MIKENKIIKLYYQECHKLEEGSLIHERILLIAFIQFMTRWCLYDMWDDFMLTWDYEYAKDYF